MAKRGRASKEEVKFVKDNFGILTTNEIALKLDRSIQFVNRVIAPELFTEIASPELDKKQDDMQAEIDRLNSVIAAKDAELAAAPKPINMHNIEKAGFVVSRDPSGKSKGMIIGTEAAAQKSDDGFAQKKTNVTLRRFSDSIHRPSEG